MEILGKSILVMKAQSDVVLEFLYVTVSTGENHLICSMFRTEFCAEHPKLTYVGSGCVSLDCPVR